MTKQSASKTSIQKKLLNLLELIIHFVLIVIVPVVFLQFTTGFNKYKLPDFIIYVYLYWLLFLIIVPIFYHLINKKK